MRLPDLVIPDGVAFSNALDGEELLRFMDSITIHAPASLAGVTNIQVSHKSAATALDAEYRLLDSDGTPIALVAGQASPLIKVAGWMALRLTTTVPPTGAETYSCTGEEKLMPLHMGMM